MARKPRAMIPKSSGQGVSRYSYQHAYSLGQHGAGGGPLKLDASLSKISAPPRAAGSVKMVEPKANWNLSYGSTWGDGKL